MNNIHCKQIRFINTSLKRDTTAIVILTDNLGTKTKRLDTSPSTVCDSPLPVFAKIFQ